ncbi:hypothetical protein RND81_07G172300 [Saponaria officinalis]|uniref:Protein DETOXIFICATION n=1 Tax=Saponaria officinalis TaxID=3572 RepID=A0AAW1JPJ1_SAPOF
MDSSLDLQNTLLITKPNEKNKDEIVINSNNNVEEIDNKAIFFGSNNGEIIRIENIREEVKKQMWLGGPLIVVSLLQFCIQIISIMFVGHLGELSLSSASLATSFSSVTGASVLVGMASALETLCGQSYGAKQYKMLGIYIQRAMICLLIICIPLAFVWYYTGEILIRCGQDHEISKGAETFNRWMIPTLFCYAVLQCLNRFLQTQNLVFPMLMFSGLTALFHLGVCWFLIFKMELGIKGAALANDVSYFVNAGFLALYVVFSPACSQTWTGFSKDAFNELGSFLKLAVPSTLMVCLEYASLELVVLLSGLLPNPKLETSVLSISLNTCWLVYMVSFGLGGTISTRVANELGAGRPDAAKLALFVMAMISLSEGLIVVVITILVRNIWGRLYSNEDEVISYVTKMMPLLALSDFIDGIQCVLSGAARGCGWQKLCAFINLGAYYFVGIPCAAILAFVMGYGGMGLWMGVICGLSVQVIVLFIINVCTDWEKEAARALFRVTS